MNVLSPSWKKLACTFICFAVFSFLIKLLTLPLRNKIPVSASEDPEQLYFSMLPLSNFTETDPLYELENCPLEILKYTSLPYLGSCLTVIDNELPPSYGKSKFTSLSDVNVAKKVVFSLISSTLSLYSHFVFGSDFVSAFAATTCSLDSFVELPSSEDATETIMTKVILC